MTLNCVILHTGKISGFHCNLDLNSLLKLLYLINVDKIYGSTYKEIILLSFWGCGHILKDMIVYAEEG